MVYSNNAAAAASSSQPSPQAAAPVYQMAPIVLRNGWIYGVEFQKPTFCQRVLNLVLSVGSIAAYNISQKVLEQLKKSPNGVTQITVRGEAEEAIYTIVTKNLKEIRQNLVYQQFPPDQIELILNLGTALPTEFFEGKHLTYTRQDDLTDKLKEAEMAFYLFCMQKLNGIRVLKSDYGHEDTAFLGAAPTIPFNKLSCFQYALLSIQENQAKESLLQNSDLAPQILEKLVSWGYKVFLQPQPGDLVLYYHYCGPGSVHMGRVNANGLMESKFNDLPGIYEHELFATPDRFADRVIFLRK